MNPGYPTDDTEMALCILRSFLKDGRFDPNSIAKEFVLWMRSGPNDIGTTTRRTLQICENSNNYWDGGLQFWLLNPQYAANGSLMRNGIIAGMANSLEEAFDFTLKCGMITHYAPLPQICCLAQTYLIWELSRGMRPLDGWKEQFVDKVNEYFSNVQDEEIRKWVINVTEKGKYERAKGTFNEANWNMEEFNPFGIDSKGIGYCLLTLQIGLWGLYWSLSDSKIETPKGFPQEVFEAKGPARLAWVAMCGYDADTYCAVAGAFIAASHTELPIGMTKGLLALETFNNLMKPLGGELNMDSITGNTLNVNKICSPTDKVDRLEEEGMLELTNEEEQPLDLPQDKRRVYSEKNDRSIFELFRRYNRGDLILDPKFQRGYVWDSKKACKLIESVVLEIPIPAIYLAQEKDGKFTLIDGQQRLKSFFRFLNNEFKLKNLVVLPNLDDKFFKDLDKDIQTKIEDSTLRTIELRKETHPDVRFEIFERLNVGAVRLNDQELRNCVYRGEYNDLITDLAENNEDFKKILNAKEPQKRMQDRELVLHFLAFKNQTYLNYKPPMKRFLNDEMELNRNITSEKRIKLERIFKESVALTETVFGDKAFRRFTRGDEKAFDGKWEKPVNIGLFEVIMVGFSSYKRNQIKEYSDIIRDELIQLMTSNDQFINSISGTGTTNTDKVRQRFKIWDEALEKIVGMPKSEPRIFEYALKEDLYYEIPNEKPKCDRCGNKIMLIEDAAIDHKIPYINGGKTNRENASLTHRFCNLQKGKRSSS